MIGSTYGCLAEETSSHTPAYNHHRFLPAHWVDVHGEAGHGTPRAPGNDLVCLLPKAEQSESTPWHVLGEEANKCPLEIGQGLNKFVIDFAFRNRSATPQADLLGSHATLLAQLQEQIAHLPATGRNNHVLLDSETTDSGLLRAHLSCWHCVDVFELHTMTLVHRVTAQPLDLSRTQHVARSKLTETLVFKAAKAVACATFAMIG